MSEERTQNELAQERTHAAWLRTALAFLVAAIAFRHYTDDWVTGGVFGVGATTSAYRAILLAPDTPSILTSYALLGVSIAAGIVSVVTA